MKEARLEIEHLAKALESRKHEKLKTVLILGTKAGALFRNPKFFEDMSLLSPKSLVALSMTEQFREAFSILKAERNKSSLEDIKILLTSAIGNSMYATEDTCLAELVKQNIFNTIFSLNMDDLLYNAFIGHGMKYQHHFEDFALGSWQPDYTIQEIQSNKRPNVCQLIRLYNDEPAFIYSLNNNKVYEENSRIIRLLLEKWQVRELLIVDWEVAWDNILPSALPASLQTIWFVNEDEAAKDAFLAQYQSCEHFYYIQTTYKSFCNGLRTLIAPDFNSLHDFSRTALHDINALRSEVRKLQASIEQSKKSLEMQSAPQKSSIHTLKNSDIAPKNKMKTDVLLATTTPIETKAVLELFPGYKEITIREKIYFDLGLTNNLQVVLTQQMHMGSNGTAGSHISIKEAIEALSPLYVIMIGIAFGIDANKHDIGDILVSQYIQNYDPQRVSSGPDNKPKFENRGERVTASTLLLSRFMAAQYSPPDTWPGKPPKIDFGLILSGSKLVDHEDYRDALRSLASDAIGGEMEGIGLYHAASDKKVHWIVVKAICDWADGNKHVQKNDRQQLAAKNAAIFTLHVLRRSNLKHHRRPKQKTTDK
ncbi:5'-methylthioadenosine/S-adenosylhomocysteine nucleosidase family protein [Reticulibacter mediterranei]|nr:hypothetical protein [Reticulibacter mediterranei]